jgi:RNA polymerase sigma-70 factor (ECF subfamily)
MVSDEALFERLVAGDMTAFDQLYQRYEKPLFGMIWRELSNAQEAEDVLHETFLSVLQQRDGGRRSFKAWVFSVARNGCLNRVRSRKRSERAVQLDSGAPPNAVQLPETQLAKAQMGQLLDAAVARLPESLSSLYRLRLAGLSYDELAEVLELPLGTVKSRMHEMVTRLREEMENV